MINLLYITPHLGGGAGKAIGGWIVSTGTKYNNTIVILDKPMETKYCELCRAAGASVVISPSTDEIRGLAEKSDVVIFNWWGHPLSVKLFEMLDGVRTRLILWSHINGLNYPFLTTLFLEAFDKVMLSSPCSFGNKYFSSEERERVRKEAEIVYGTGDFKPEKHLYKKRYGINDTVRIGYLGTLDFAKMSRAFPSICHSIKERVNKVEFVLCGACTEEFRTVFLNEYPELGECTVFKGWVTETEKILTSFDIFLYPLNPENYATTENALLEAMAAGLPVVVSDNPAESSIVDNGITGIVAKDRSDMVESVIGLCNDEKQRKFLGENARKTIIEKYDIRSNEEKFSECIKQALGIEKHRHCLCEITGKDIWERFIYFCGEEGDKVLKVLAGEKVGLPGIFFSETKGSPKHYARFSDDKRIKELSERIDELI